MTENTRNKTISIITASLNQGKYIEKNILSILSQEGDFYIDFIIADGGSSDNTVEIIKKYDSLLKENKFPIKCSGVKLSYWSEKDSGQSSALNRALRMAKGEIQAFIGSDDYYLPGAFQKVKEAFDDENLDFVYGKIERIFEDNPSKKDIEQDPRENETFETLKTRGNSFGQQGTFYSKKILDKVGLLDENLRCCLDLDLWMRVFKYGKTKYVPEKLAVFRIWENSKTSTLNKRFNEEKKIIAKRYGGNLIPSMTIYKLRGKFSFLNKLKNCCPGFYNFLKKVFYNFIDFFKYSSEK